ncbi:MAG TPA: DinB family protein [Euzebyales bacterium]
MDGIGLLHDGFHRATQGVHEAVGGLDVDGLVWRPDAEANPIGWLVWHLSRIQDAQVAEITGREQLWTTADWATRFGLPAGAMDDGFGHTSDEVAALLPESADALLAYHDAVAAAVARDLDTLDADTLDRVIDERYDPPVTVAVRLVSVLDDALEHVGQAAYVRGLWDRLD